MPIRYISLLDPFSRFRTGGASLSVRGVTYGVSLEPSTADICIALSPYI